MSQSLEVNRPNHALALLDCPLDVPVANSMNASVRDVRGLSLSHMTFFLSYLIGIERK